jgi:hypothetical protein
VVVAIEAVLAVVGYIQVRPAVVVVIANRASVSPAVVGYAGLFRHVGEGAVVIVMEESRVGRGGLAGKRIVCGAVHQINVEPAVIVIVQETNAGAFGLEDEALLRRACRVMPARKSRGLGNILEDEWGLSSQSRRQ